MIGLLVRWAPVDALGTGYLAAALHADAWQLPLRAQRTAAAVVKRCAVMSSVLPTAAVTRSTLSEDTLPSQVTQVDCDLSGENIYV